MLTLVQLVVGRHFGFVGAAAGRCCRVGAGAGPGLAVDRGFFKFYGRNAAAVLMLVQVLAVGRRFGYAGAAAGFCGHCYRAGGGAFGFKF